MAISLSFSSPFLFRICSIPITVRSFSGSTRYLASRDFEQALLDSFHVERAASFQALLCSSARAESNTPSRVLRYFARRLTFFFS